MSLIYSHCISLLLLSMMPSKWVILEVNMHFQKEQNKTKKVINGSWDNMLRRPHSQTFLWLQSGPRGQEPNVGAPIPRNVLQRWEPAFILWQLAEFVSLSRLSPESTGGQMRAQPPGIPLFLPGCWSNSVFDKNRLNKWIPTPLLQQ